MSGQETIIQYETSARALSEANLKTHGARILESLPEDLRVELFEVVSGAVHDGIEFGGAMRDLELADVLLIETESDEEVSL